MLYDQPTVILTVILANSGLHLRYMTMLLNSIKAIKGLIAIKGGQKVPRQMKRLSSTKIKKNRGKFVT